MANHRKYPVGQEPYKLDSNLYRKQRRAALKAEEPDETKLLPHINGHKLYQWQKNFIEAKNKYCFITAANQAGKSTANIIKAIIWATSPRLWPTLWKTVPRQFWYLYPDLKTIKTEFESKWIPDFLPKGKMKEHKYFGWEAIIDHGNILGVKFNTGVSIWFKMYSQKTTALMASTVHAMFTDEELPIQHLPELQGRMNYTDGYFSQVFTATLGQEFWYRTMECRGERELFSEAFKQTVSLYDCLFYHDGQPSEIWTEERIEQIKKNCASENEVLRRVYGRFVSEEGVKYSSFDSTRHFVKPFPVPKDFAVYAAVDPGSGGSKNHPAAIVFIAVTPDHRRGYIYKGWRGDGVETTASDIMDKFKILRGTDKIVNQAYDWEARDFGIIAARIGEPFVKAIKHHSVGEETLNTLFKNNALLIFDIPELQPLGTELAMLRHKTNKTNAKDDFIDAVRYAATPVPWDWEGLILKDIEDKPNKSLLKPTSEMTPQEYNDWEIRCRRGEVHTEKKDSDWEEFENECRFWNEQCGNGNY